MSLDTIFRVTFNKKCAILMHWKLKKKKNIAKRKERRPRKTDL